MYLTIAVQFVWQTLSTINIVDSFKLAQVSSLVTAEIILVPVQL